MHKLTRKTVAVAAGAAVLLSGAGVAFAYWTTTGSGSGTATNASSNGTVTLHPLFAGANLTPGGTRTVTYTADNTLGTSNLYVGLITPTVTTSDPLCLASWFTIGTTLSNTTVPALSTGVTLQGSATLTFVDSTLANQDDCKGKVVTVSATSN